MFYMIIIYQNIPVFGTVICEIKMQFTKIKKMKINTILDIFEILSIKLWDYQF